ncbi:hypothetical protein JHK87_046571 [Glycine soja]|nr:hypothetical protein JHK87_046571 [Glycine soja]
MAALALALLLLAFTGTSSSGGTCVYPSSVRYVFVFDTPIIFKLSSGLICLCFLFFD